MEHIPKMSVFNLLRRVQDRLAEEAEYDYEAREIVHRISRLLAGKPPQKTCHDIKAALTRKACY